MITDGYDVEPCDCEPHVRCEHRNYHTDPDTAVMNVHSGWVEGGMNLMLFGTHGNWLAGIKETEPLCYDAGEDFDHSWCFADDCHAASASLYTSDKIGLPLTVKPGWVVREESTGPRYETRPIRIGRVSTGYMLPEHIAEGQRRFRALIDGSFGIADLRAAAEANLARASERHFLEGETDESRSEREQLHAPAERVDGEYPF